MHKFKFCLLLCLHLIYLRLEVLDSFNGFKSEVFGLGALLTLVAEYRAVLPALRLLEVVPGPVGLV